MKVLEWLLGLLMTWWDTTVGWKVYRIAYPIETLTFRLNSSNTEFLLIVDHSFRSCLV